MARISDNETVVHIINKNEEEQKLELSRFEELGLNGKTLKNIMTQEEIKWNTSLNLKTKGSSIFTTKL
jgi:hypothetical protein